MVVFYFSVFVGLEQAGYFAGWCREYETPLPWFEMTAPTLETSRSGLEQPWRRWAILMSKELPQVLYH